MNQSELKANARIGPSAGNVWEQGRIGSFSTPDGLKKWRKFFRPTAKRGENRDKAALSIITSTDIPLRQFTLLCAGAHKRVDQFFFLDDLRNGALFFILLSKVSFRNEFQLYEVVRVATRMTLMRTTPHMLKAMQRKREILCQFPAKQDSCPLHLKTRFTLPFKWKRLCCVVPCFVFQQVF